MKVDLNDEEAALISAMIKARIAELGPEIRHIRTPEFHDELKDEKARLKAILERLVVCEPPDPRREKCSAR